MTRNQITVLLNYAAAQATEKALTAAGIQQPDYSKAQAYKLFGRSNVDRWMNEGLIKMVNKKINRLKLDTIAAASNRFTYRPVAGR